VDDGGRLAATLLDPHRVADGLPPGGPPAFTRLAVRDLLPDGVRRVYDGGAGGE